MPTQLNPFEVPSNIAIDVGTSESALEVEFEGALTSHEFSDLQCLVGSNKTKAAQKFWWFVFGGVVMVAMSYDMLISGEFDHVMEHTTFMIGLLFVGAVYVYQQRNQRRDIDRLASDQQGAFASVRGRFEEAGVTFWANSGCIPVEYEWRDFVGYRHKDDVIVLYTDFPLHLNVLSASRFGDQGVWQRVVATVAEHVPKIAVRARSAPRPVSGRQKLINDAFAHMLAQRFEEANALWDELLANERADASICLAKGTCLAAIGQKEAAFSSISKAKELGARDLTTLLLSANLSAELGNLSFALQEFNVLLEQSPKDFEFWRGRGLVHLKMGNYESALADTDQALSLNEDDPVAHNNRGVALLELGQCEAAKKALQRALELDPKFERPRVHLDRIAPGPSKSISK